MNQLISTHYASVDEGDNEYRVYECFKKNKVKYIAVIHSSNIKDIADEKILVERFPCIPPKEWSIHIIKRLDNHLTRLQLLANSDLRYLVFSPAHKEYVSKKVKDMILEINEVYVRLQSETSTV